MWLLFLKTGYNIGSHLQHLHTARVCEVGTVCKISDCQPEGPRFNSLPARGFNFEQPSSATPSMDRDVKPLV